MGAIRDFGVFAGGAPDGAGGGDFAADVGHGGCAPEIQAQGRGEELLAGDFVGGELRGAVVDGRGEVLTGDGGEAVGAGGADWGGGGGGAHGLAARATPDGELFAGDDEIGRGPGAGGALGELDGEVILGLRVRGGAGAQGRVEGDGDAGGFLGGEGRERGGAGGEGEAVFEECPAAGLRVEGAEEIFVEDAEARLRGGEVERGDEDVAVLVEDFGGVRFGGEVGGHDAVAKEIAVVGPVAVVAAEGVVEQRAVGGDAGGVERR